jgi:hypothetical protein
VAQVYSEVIADLHGVSTDTVVEIPLSDDYIWVVRDITFFAPGAVTANFQVYDDQDCTFMYDEVAEAGFSAYTHWQGRQVFPPSGRALFTTVTGITIESPTYDVRISGYRLTLP